MPTPKTAPPKISMILLPTDFSAASERAGRYTVYLCKLLGARLHVLHVIDLQTFGTYGREHARDHGPFIEELHKVAEERLSEFLKKIDAEELASAHIEKFGMPPAEEICKDAQEMNADLIVMATHGRKGVDRFLLGSVVDRVIRTAPCPVLTVRSGYAD